MATTKLRKKDFAKIRVDIINLNLRSYTTDHLKIIASIQSLERALSSTSPTDANRDILKNYAVWLAVLTQYYSNKIENFQEKNDRKQNRVTQEISNITVEDTFTPEALLKFKVGGLGTGMLALGGVIALIIILSVPLLWASIAFTAIGIATGLFMLAGNIYNHYKEYQQENLKEVNGYLDDYNSNIQQIRNNLSTKYDLKDEIESLATNAASYTKVFAKLPDLDIEIKEPEVKSNFLTTLCH